MEGKNGQISLFIIIGLLIILLLGGVLFFFNDFDNSDKLNYRPSLPKEIEPIANYIDDCLYISSEEAVSYVLNQGGYYSLTGRFEEFLSFSVPYYYASNHITLPSKTFVEQQMALYIENNLVSCLEGLESYKQKGFVVDKSDIDVSVQIIEDKVLIKDTGVAKVSYAELENYNINGFNAIVEADAKGFLSSSENITLHFSSSPDRICISCIESLAKKYGFTSSIIPEDGFYYISFSDNKDNHNYSLNFLLEIENKEITKDIVLESFEQQSVMIGYDFYYKVNVTGNNLMFKDNCYMFNIDEFTGEIQFTPTEADLGSHLVEIIVNNSLGEYEYGYLPIEVVRFNSGPRVDYIGMQTAKVGQEFIYLVNAEDSDDDSLIYYADTTMFDIANNGSIAFVALEEYVGMHKINISVYDSRGGQSTQLMELMIVR